MEIHTERKNRGKTLLSVFVILTFDNLSKGFRPLRAFFSITLICSDTCFLLHPGVSILCCPNINFSVTKAKHVAPGGNRKPVSEHISVIEKNARDGLKPLDKLSKVKITNTGKVFFHNFSFQHEFPPEFRSVEN